MIDSMLPIPTLAEVTLNGRSVLARADTTILEVCRVEGVDIPTMCFLETLSPFNSCRLCVVEVAGSGALVPSCSRTIDDGMEITQNPVTVPAMMATVCEALGLDPSSTNLSNAGRPIPLADHGAESVADLLAG